MNVHSEIKVMDSALQAIIDIEGVIGVPERVQFGSADERVATYGRFAASLAAIKGVQASEVVVNIRSTGGDVNDALLIYDALKELDAKVITRCYGYVASAATIIAQAASEGCREISPSALYLIHCSESAAEGNSQSLSAAKELLDRTDERIAAIYAVRSGRAEETYVELMKENGGRGRWITAEEAIGLGLADTFTFSGVTNEAEGVPWGDDGELAELCRMFGLTPPPSGELAASRDRMHGGSIREAGRALWRVLRRLFRDGTASSSHGDAAALPESSVAEECRTLHVKGVETCGHSEPEGVKASVVSLHTGENSPEGPAHEAARDLSVKYGEGDKEIGLPKDKAVVIAIRTAQSAAFPTLTKDVEDPGMDERAPSPNEQAYLLDAMSMRHRM